MKLKILFLIFSVVIIKFKAQSYVFGNVYNDSQVQLPAVLVINVNTEEQTYTNVDGNFMIKASIGNQLRFVRQNYERISVKINAENLAAPLKVTMQYNPTDIETVVLNYKPTGNLKEDIKHYGPPKKVVKLNKEIGTYIHAYSSPEIMKPKVGEFVQPKGKGFETRKIGYQWKILDLQMYLEETLTMDYFKSMGLQDLEILPFIKYALRNFDTNDILRFGRVTSSDLAHFQVEAERRIKTYKSQNKKK